MPLRIFLKLLHSKLESNGTSLRSLNGPSNRTSSTPMKPEFLLLQANTGLNSYRFTSAIRSLLYARNKRLLKSPLFTEHSFKESLCHPKFPVLFEMRQRPIFIYGHSRKPKMRKPFTDHPNWVWNWIFHRKINDSEEKLWIRILNLFVLKRLRKGLTKLSFGRPFSERTSKLWSANDQVANLAHFQPAALKGIYFSSAALLMMQRYFRPS